MRPNLFIVGAMKAATTSVAQFLSTIDAIQMCPTKEPQHFCTDLHRHPDFAALPQIRAFDGQEWVLDREQYLALFPPSGAARYAAEASTTYLYSERAAAEIAAFNPDARIVILLRQPVRRAFSEYQMNRKIGLARGSFAQEMAADQARVERGEFRLFERYVHAGLYARQVQRFLDRFPKEHVFIAAIDQPGEDVNTVAARLCGFLGVAAPGGVPRLNEAGSAAFPGLNRILFESGIKGWISRRFPPGLKNAFKRVYYSGETPPTLDAAELARWTEIFAPDIEALSRITGHDFSFWLKQ